jgi:hypothetical protein
MFRLGKEILSLFDELLFYYQKFRISHHSTTFPYSIKGLLPPTWRCSPLKFNGVLYQKRSHESIVK